MDKRGYRATFGIDCGLSHGFGLKEPHYEKQEQTVVANNDKDALLEAAKCALKFSYDYLSNPDTKYTTVTLLSFFNPDGDPLNQKDIIQKAGYCGIKRFNWDGEKLLTKCHMIEHLARVPPKNLDQAVATP